LTGAGFFYTYRFYAFINNDKIVKRPKEPIFVTPAKAGVQ